MGKGSYRWREGTIVPIWKKGEKRDPKNYRGIMMTSTVHKIYANILNERVIKELDNNNGSRTQAGFRRGKGTIEKLRY